MKIRLGDNGEIIVTDENGATENIAAPLQGPAVSVKDNSVTVGMADVPGPEVSLSGDLDMRAFCLVVPV